MAEKEAKATEKKETIKRAADKSPTAKKTNKAAADKKPATAKSAVDNTEKSTPKKTVEGAAKKEAASPVKSTGKLKITLIKSLTGRHAKHIATAKSLGLKRIGNFTVQPDNLQTRGKIDQIGYMITVTEA